MKNGVYSIPAGLPFAKTLARQLLDETRDNPENLAKIQILLPTRRACRVLREAFLQISNGQALILPRMQPVGDIDEEELSLSIADPKALKGFLEIKPAISPLRRQLLLARLIESAQDFHQGFDHALLLAAALGRFMDQIYTENLKLSDLHDIVPAEFSSYWQLTLEFLKILGDTWPTILEEQGVIDSADRRNRLILALTDHWRTNPPQSRIIVAGTTGSIPAVARLLQAVKNLPQGQIVLPGLDHDLDEESWNTLDETHPQYGFRQLLERMGLHRTDVQTWPHKTDTPASVARRHLATEIMRPAQTTSQWTTLGTNKAARETFHAAFEDFHLYECKTEREEAEIIALMMRETLQSHGKTAALITPDRNLARRVSMACQRWNITLDDSAGQTLDQSSAGTFFRLILQAVQNDLRPVPLLSLLKHKLSRVCTSAQIQSLEEHALRGLRPASGFTGLYDRLTENRADETTINAVRALEQTLHPLLSIQSQTGFATILKTHIEVAEQLCGQREKLWSREDGEALSALLSELIEQSAYMPNVNLHTYAQIIDQVMRTVTVRPAYGTHPRLMILGQLEARLIDADLVILGGLNEGTWPPAPSHDPWMSRPMRKDFGLPIYERSIGLAAHDFTQGFCSPRIALTRAKRSENAPTLPARWLQRLETVLKATGLPPVQTHIHLHWAALMDKAENIMPIERPKPCPPTDLRPTKLSATRIETWLKDPYSIYARYILNLQKLEPLERDIDAALRGDLLHKILQRFVETYKTHTPPDAFNILHQYAKEEIGTYHTDQEVWSFWWPRFSNICHWYLTHEDERNRTHKNLKTEVKGALELDDFTVTAKADRIDRTPDGVAVIDYKSGGTYTKKSIQYGQSPQLGVEALIMADGDYDSITNHPVFSLEYWLLTGKSSEPGKVIAIEGTENIAEIIERTREGLKALIAAFKDPNTPYYSLPRANNKPRFNDYEHLARAKEWSVYGDDDTAGGTD